MKLFITISVLLYFLNSVKSIPSEDVIRTHLTSVLVVSIIISKLTTNKTKMKNMYFQMYRHGDRTLRESFPNDPFFNKKHIPEGFGAFLNVSRDIIEYL